jgi:hypothetical protein
MTRVPLVTAGTLPITGAAISRAPFSSAALASSSAMPGPAVLRSTMVFPAAAANTPSGPRETWHNA